MLYELCFPVCNVMAVWQPCMAENIVLCIDKQAQREQGGKDTELLQISSAN